MCNAYIFISFSFDTTNDSSLLIVLLFLYFSEQSLLDCGVYLFLR